ncbi:hypothetical protein [Rhizobacter sp. Root1221]|uniref:hypothetical protein n=1 Tax=Rhizobacter sp. Root1221 TaxID=1736433 RepID=UPI0006FB2E0E|nr:hypothetical protein [Rhizobacter sp. Root1221]KQW00076.1 hypothetical protein ASC87_18825 [Rhizobacter sp. Root1221]
MINFDSVARASDDFWYDHEFEVIQAQVERLSPSDWDEFERRCLLLPCQSQERVAYVLGGIDTVASARLLLQLCKRSERDTVLTAREAVRSMTLESVTRAASDLWPSAGGRTINEVLDWVEGAASVPRDR